MTLVYAKKSTHPEKKAQKALQPIKKKQATEKKHYSAFKKHSLRSLQVVDILVQAQYTVRTSSSEKGEKTGK